MSTARPARQAGFSLLELSVVLIIIALGTAIALPMVEAGWDAREVRRAARQIASTMHYCRGEAVSLGVPQEMVLDSNENRYYTTGWGRWAILTDRATLAEIHGGVLYGDGVVHIVFYPNGSTTGAEVVVASRRDPRDRRLHVVLDGLLGTIHVGDES